jgi:hypothetical protein
MKKKPLKTTKRVYHWPLINSLMPFTPKGAAKLSFDWVDANVGKSKIIKIVKDSIFILKKGQWV